MQNISIVVDVQEKIFKTCVHKKYLFWKSPHTNPNPNPQLKPRVRVGVNSWKKGKR